MSIATPTRPDVEARLRRFGHWIGGHEVAPSSGEYLVSTNPTDRSESFHIAAGNESDAELAMRSAISARTAWARTTTAERAAHMRAVADAVRARIDELIEVEVAETGKLEAHARIELLSAADYFDYYAGIVRTLHGKTIDQGPGQHTYVRHEPYGVVAIITPWNGPVNQGARGAAPAIAAGNVVVIKPSEFTSAATLVLAKIASDAGLPAGVFNVVTGTGAAVGGPLVTHTDVRRITFTGSVPTGRAIGHVAAERVVPVTLELGGKSPLVVFADADLDGAARACAFTVLANSGQVCSATTRLLVERSVQDELLQRTAAILSHTQPGRDFGPIITEPQFGKVLEYFDAARAEGAVAVTGGRCYREGAAADGRYIEPTLYRDVTPNMRIAREEIFGPVLAAMPFDTEAEAIERANDSEYGLAAAVWSGDVARGIRVAEQLEAGQVAVNGGLMGQETPFGGYKSSGIGREKGVDAIYEYTQTKAVSIAL